MKMVTLKINCKALTGGEGKYVICVSFSWPLVIAALSTFKQITVRELLYNLHSLNNITILTPKNKDCNDIN